MWKDLYMDISVAGPAQPVFEDLVIKKSTRPKIFLISFVTSFAKSIITRHIIHAFTQLYLVLIFVVTVGFGILGSSGINTQAQALDDGSNAPTNPVLSSINDIAINSPNIPNVTSVTSVRPGSIIFSEINFAGSNWEGCPSCSYDKWIELHNTTSQEISLNGFVIRFKGSLDPELNLDLSGYAIGADGYFLISNKRAGVASLLDQVGITPNLKSGKVLNISNNQTKTVQASLLYQSTTPIDTVDINSSFFGQLGLKNELKYSLERTGQTWNPSNSLYFQGNYGSPHGFVYTKEDTGPQPALNQITELVVQPFDQAIVLVPSQPVPIVESVLIPKLEVFQEQITSFENTPIPAPNQQTSDGSEITYSLPGLQREPRYVPVLEQIIPFIPDQNTSFENTLQPIHSIPTSIIHRAILTSAPRHVSLPSLIIQDQLFLLVLAALFCIRKNKKGINNEQRSNELTHLYIKTRFNLNPN